MTRRDWIWLALVVALSLAGLSERSRVERDWQSLYMRADHRAFRWEQRSYYWKREAEACCGRELPSW